MRTRCFLFRYATGAEVVRWLHDDGCSWIQQVLKLSLDTGELKYTGGDPNAIFHVAGLERLVEGGNVEEL